jgi:hypothetical protein
MAKRYAEAIKILDVANGSHSAQQDVSRQALPAAQDLKKEGERILESIEQLQQQELKTLHSIESVEKTIESGALGQLRLQPLEFLKAEGLQINCFSCPTNEWGRGRMSDKYYAPPSNQRDGRTYSSHSPMQCQHRRRNMSSFRKHSLHYYRMKRKD